MASQGAGRRENPVDHSIPAVGRFAEQLRALRRDAGLTLRELAQRTHNSTTVLQNATTGRQPPAEHIARAWVRACVPHTPENDPWEAIWESRYQRAVGAYTARHTPALARSAEPASSGSSTRESASAAGAAGDWSPPPALLDALSQACRPPRAWGFEDAPWRMPIRWSATSDHLRAGFGDLPLDGQGEEIAEAYAAVPTGRLVILGEAGAGATELALALARSLLAASPARLPLVLPLRLWRPDKLGLKDWIVEQLHHLCPDTLGPGTADDSGDQAQILVDQGRILPILDGLQDVPAPLRPAVLKALEWEIGGEPFVLTTRRREYNRAVETRSQAPQRVAAIRIDKPTLADLEAWLPVGIDTAVSARKWEPVRRALRAPDGARLADLMVQVLSTAAIAAVARQLYSDTPADPLELLDFAQTGDHARLTARLARHHLVLNFAPGDVFLPGRRDHGLYSAAVALELLGRQRTKHSPPGIRALMVYRALGPLRLTTLMTGALLAVDVAISIAFGTAWAFLNLVPIPALYANLHRWPRNLALFNANRDKRAEKALRFMGQPGLALILVAVALGTALASIYGSGFPYGVVSVDLLLAVARMAVSWLAAALQLPSAIELLRCERRATWVIAAAAFAFTVAVFTNVGLQTGLYAACAVLPCYLMGSVSVRWGLARLFCPMIRGLDLPVLLDESTRRGVLRTEGSVFHVRYPQFAEVLLQRGSATQFDVQEPMKRAFIDMPNAAAVSRRWPTPEQN